MTAYSPRTILCALLLIYGVFSTAQCTLMKAKFYKSQERLVEGNHVVSQIVQEFGRFQSTMDTITREVRTDTLDCKVVYKTKIVYVYLPASVKELRADTIPHVKSNKRSIQPVTPLMVTIKWPLDRVAQDR